MASEEKDSGDWPAEFEAEYQRVRPLGKGAYGLGVVAVVLFMVIPLPPMLVIAWPPTHAAVATLHACSARTGRQSPSL